MLPVLRGDSDSLLQIMPLPLGRDSYGCQGNGLCAGSAPVTTHTTVHVHRCKYMLVVNVNSLCKHGSIFKVIKQKVSFNCLKLKLKMIQMTCYA